MHILGMQKIEPKEVQIIFSQTRMYKAFLR